MTDKEIIAHWDDISRSMEQGEKSGAKITEVRMSKGVAEATYNLIKRLKRESNSYRNKAKGQKGELARLYKQNAEYKAEIDAMRKFIHEHNLEWELLSYQKRAEKIEHNSLCETETYKVGE